MLVVRVLTGLGFLGLALLTSGCASYYTHYGAFSASNSAGEARQFLVTWQTAEYPGWWFADDEATPITLQTQCSARQWKLDDGGKADEPGASGPGCGLGIVACGETGKDILAASGERATSGDRCMAVSDAPDVVNLGRQINLSVYCRPLETAVTVNGELENQDYLRASVVPYEISVKKVVRNSLNARPPELGERICDDE